LNDNSNYGIIDLNFEFAQNYKSLRLITRVRILYSMRTQCLRKAKHC